ncbi:MAG: hypothetical protein Q4D76_18470, partial [Oscillospiraceae bacterium]|nr:hypothetical protein [Oscillospiraceae bacterium]
STESEYRFLVTQNTKLTAQFADDDAAEPTNRPSSLPNNTTGNSVNDNKVNNNSVQNNVKNYATKINLKSKITYRKSKKVTVSDKDGLKSVRINRKTVKLNGRKSFSFKLSKYKKYLKRKGKWNKLVVTDTKKKKKTIKFKTK